MRKGNRKTVAMKKQFIGTCVDNPFGDLETLENVIDGAVEIARAMFLASCDVSRELVRDMLEYPFDYGFYQSEHEGNTIYFFTHSAIEHFFA